MPTQNENSGELQRLAALRRAVQLGIDDLEAGRYREFASFADLEAYLRELTNKVLAKRHADRNARR
jgi:antitoxin ParD1/3/4